MARGPPAGPRPRPSVSEFLANHQNPMSNPIPNCFVLNNDSYIKEQRFNPGKGIPWQGPKTQLVNLPPATPGIKSSPSRACSSLCDAFPMPWPILKIRCQIQFQSLTFSLTTLI